MKLLKENVYILIPAFEPDEKLLPFVEALRQQGYQVLVVDDGSGVGYVQIFHEVSQQTMILTHEVNRGKGAALRTGLGFLQEVPDCRAVITADADGQHRIQDVNAVYEELKRSIFVLGSRRFTGKVPLRSRFGNTVTRMVFTVATGVRIRDTQTGLRGFHKDLFEQMIAIEGNRYEYEINVLLYAARNKIPICEVDIATIYEPGNKSSHFHTIRDSYRVYSEIIKFSASGLIAFLLDFFLLMLFDFILDRLGFSAAEEGESLIFSVVAARMISSAVNFTVNRRIVFRSRKPLRKELWRYYALVLLILAVNSGIIYLLNIVCNLPLIPAKLITELILFFVSFVIQKTVVFKNCDI